MTSVTVAAAMDTHLHKNFWLSSVSEASAPLHHLKMPEQKPEKEVKMENAACMSKYIWDSLWRLSKIRWLWKAENFIRIVERQLEEYFLQLLFYLSIF